MIHFHFHNAPSVHTGAKSLFPYCPVAPSVAPRVDESFDLARATYVGIDSSSHKRQTGNPDTYITANSYSEQMQGRYSSSSDPISKQQRESCMKY